MHRDHEPAKFSGPLPLPLLLGKRGLGRGGRFVVMMSFNPHTSFVIKECIGTLNPRNFLVFSLSSSGSSGGEGWGEEALLSAYGAQSTYKNSLEFNRT